jgi:hypothetical protein
MYFKFGNSSPHFFDDEVWKKLDSASFPFDLVADSTVDDPWIFPKYITNSLGDEIELSYNALENITRLASEPTVVVVSKLDYITLNHILFFRFNKLNKYLRNELVKKF